MNLLKALATVSGMTLISRILGFVRDVLIARIFGAGIATDAFFVAFRIPNLLRRLFAEGAFSQAFVPILAEYKNRRTAEETRELINHVTTLLSIVLFLVTLIGVIAAPLVIYVSAPGFAASPQKFALTIELLRITFPYILFISLVSLAGGILNTYGRFSVPALTPALLNLSFIGCSLWLAPLMDPPVLALAWAVFIGGLLQLAFQAPFLMRMALMPRPRLRSPDTGAWRVIRQMGPAVFGVSIGQISLVINTIFASFLITGVRRQQPKGAVVVRRLDRPDQLVDQHNFRVFPHHRQRAMALLRRQVDGISRWPPRRGAWDNIAAVAVPPLCR